MVYRCLFPLFPILYIEYMRIREKGNTRTYTPIYARIEFFTLWKRKTETRENILQKKDVEKLLVKTLEMVGNLALKFLC